MKSRLKGLFWRRKLHTTRYRQGVDALPSVWFCVSPFIARVGLSITSVLTQVDVSFRAFEKTALESG
ncbi:MAG: hypothetical protein WCO51_00235 [bacterium]